MEWKTEVYKVPRLERKMDKLMNIYFGILNVKRLKRLLVALLMEFHSVQL